MHKLGAMSAASRLTHLWWLEQQHYIAKKATVGDALLGAGSARPSPPGPHEESRPELMRRLQGHVAAAQQLLRDGAPRG